ncbi:MAG: aldehyde dehydrogenase [Alphaproteobacteria bacterium]|nr:aldehyde dehydrogenase [Alphaproteobacteria bacterium]
MLLDLNACEMERRAAAIELPHLAVIGGRLVASQSGATFDNISSRNGQLLNRTAAGDKEDVDLAVGAARRAFEDGRWRAMAPADRKKILHRLADLMERHADELAILESLDTGKPIRDAANVDIPLSIQSARWYAEALDKVYGEVGPTPPNRLSFAVHEPLGVIGAVVPWNFPLLMAMWKVAPALAMGNSVVLKPAEQSPMTALRLGALALEAGLPDGVLNVVPGLGETAGQAIGRHMDVDMIAFTGSGAVGRRLMIYSGESNLKRVSLELGGKSPQIVFADCPDFEAAAQAAFWGVFYNQGEVCTAASRLLVHRSVKDKLLSRVLEIAQTVSAGDPLDPATRFGAMVSEGQMNTVLRYIDIARADGGRLVLGGHRANAETGGFYVAPTIFDDIGNRSRLAREEVFGPVLGVIAFDTAEEALTMANDTDYGLAAGIWTGDLNLAHRAAQKLRAGLVWVNGWDACDITMPFGGFKQSGFGRDRSLHAMHKYADLKSISITLR